jgi:hypothetical protein
VRAACPHRAGFAYFSTVQNSSMLSTSKSSQFKRTICAGGASSRTICINHFDASTTLFLFSATAPGGLSRLKTSSEDIVMVILTQTEHLRSNGQALDSFSIVRFDSSSPGPGVRGGVMKKGTCHCRVYLCFFLFSFFMHVTRLR